ncbi:Dyp-type peroxidase [Kitasatospora sp. NPDC089509]|uniref:Dyp-type peroxidase n=1 Tax=Kitasatospora sp. NPDC089509 TaxID=3364079 RepID=UPI003830556A
MSPDFETNHAREAGPMMPTRRTVTAAGLSALGAAGLTMAGVTAAHAQPTTTLQTQNRAVPEGDLPLRNSDDIQGDVLAGFRKDQASFLMLGFRDATTARAWLGRVLPEIASTRQVAAFNTQFSEARKQAGGHDPLGLVADWTGLSLTYRGLTLLAGKEPFPRTGADAFRQGPAKRSKDIGDIETSAPQNWLFGAPSGPVIDAVLTLASDDPAHLANTVHRHRKLAGDNCVSVFFQQDGATLPGSLRGHEHFGFADGVSQPAVRGFDAADPNGHDALGRPGTRILPPEQFVVGANGVRPALPRWATNGSFQVIRRLAQNVPGWRAQLGPQLAALKKAGAAPAAVTDGWLAARLVGRWPSGTPVARCPLADVPPAAGATADNSIDFHDDQAGLITPLFSHLRKTNPRAGLAQRDDGSLDFKIADERRLIRRGIPFGPAFDPAAAQGTKGTDAPRGLVFVSYQADLERQFEFLQRSWINNANFPQNQSGADPVIGKRGDVRFDTARGSVPLTFDAFVRTEGALYAFTPAITTLRELVAGRLDTRDA